MRKYIAELFGTLVLVFVGCGTVVFSEPYVGNIGIALAFGLAVTAMIYTIGSISGAHINPAVTLGMWTSGRIKIKDVIGYIAFQFIGAVLGTGLIYSIIKGHISGYDIRYIGLGQNGYGLGYAGGYDLYSAILFELVATFIFVKVVLKTTESDLKIAGVVIGLTLIAIHILGLPITGVSVNPARSFGPALFVGGEALSQLWLFLVVPSFAGIFAGLSDHRCCFSCEQTKNSKKAPKSVATAAKNAKENKEEYAPKRRHSPAHHVGRRAPANRA